ncbi:SMI1/KNR4 family protein [Kutzneria buriramensis]|uniref:SUKH superfamily protein n=1 Tax=Kutzneria buriramensis TaxID=1045776 RepID=A0A3E0H6D6_9PSEU|nr:SMI1/KNR4 family protein [Kutzneria buriramensis]REH38220.1 SUKH superfamily protein [Kutzneria buriramensis]
MADFDEIKAVFWGDGTYDVQPPLTDEAVREAEELLGVSLPAALIDLLRIQNGGMVACGRRRFPTTAPTSWAADHAPLTDLMGIGRTKGVTSLLDVPYLIEEWELPAGLVPVSGDGHCWIALDYRRSAEPTVTWVDTDLRAELALAPDFRSFVEGLTGR